VSTPSELRRLLTLLGYREISLQNAMSDSESTHTLLVTHRIKRNHKVMRRITRAAYLRPGPGDISSLENPQAVNVISYAP
jgi:hypothetical protein